MGFAQELKDFVGAVEKGWKMATPNAAEATLWSRQKALELEEKDRAQRAPRAYGDNNVPIAGEITDGSAPPVRRTGASGALAAIEGGTDMARYATAIQSNESGGRYDIVGPTHKKYGRALGAYQVMETNLPVWSKQVLGRVVDPDEFLKNPKIQDQIFAAKFGEYVSKYGNPRDAASAWFTGRRYKDAIAAGAKDSLGTRVEDYVRKFERAGGGRPRVAALDLEDEEVPTVLAAEGGLIDAYAGYDEHAGSNPAVRASTEEPDDTEAVIPAMFSDGLEYLQSKFQMGRSAITDVSPRSREAVKALAHNVGAPNPDDVSAIMSTADPDLPLDKKAIMGWSNYYRYHTSQGNPEAAARGAAAMLLHSRRLSQRAGTLAMVALERGDVKGAANAIKAAYDHIPDGVALKVNEAGTGGVEYEQIDLKGKSIKGKASVDDLKELAKGMMDGTQWFQTVSAARLPVDKQAQRASRRSAARSEFESVYSAEDEEGFIAGLSEDARKKFLKMDPSDRKEYLQRHLREGENEAKSERFQQRMQRQAETHDRKEALDLFKFGIRYGQWETMREQVLTENEKRARQREDEEAGRNNRQQLSFAERRKRDEEMIKRRTKTTDGAGVKLTAKEAAEGRRVSAIDTGLSAAEASALPDAAIGDDGMPDYTAAQRRPVMKAQAEAGYMRMDPKEREVSEDDFTAIRTKIPEVWKGDDVSKADQLWAARIASDIKTTSGNQLTNDDAIDVMMSAVNSKTEPRVMRDGSIIIDPRLPPVRMTGESLMMLATMRERVRSKQRTTSGGNSRPVSAVAVPGTSAPTSERVVAEARAGTLRDRQLRQELGDAYEPGMTIPEMEAAVLALRRERSRSGRALDVGIIERGQEEWRERQRRQRRLGNIR